jgi:hypothetical protein
MWSKIPQFKSHYSKYTWCTIFNGERVKKRVLCMLWVKVENYKLPPLFTICWLSLLSFAAECMNFMFDFKYHWHKNLYQIWVGPSWPWSYGSWIYNYQCCEIEFHPGEVYSIQQYVIKFVSDLQQVNGFLLLLRFPPSIKLTTTI